MSLSQKTKNPKAFTLVELIVVITILVILWIIAFTQMGGFSGNARDSQRISDLTNISQWLDLTYIKLSSYPTPDNTINVTYSGWVLWYQWTVGDTVMNILSSNGAKLSHKTTDPLITTQEYTYSKTANSSYSYQLKTDYEWDTIAYRSINNLIPQARAASGNPTIAYIKGTYNGVVTKTITGSTTYIIASPSIITSQTGTIGTNFEITTLPNKLLLSGQTNSGWIAFTGKLVYSSGALPSTDAERLTFATNLANTYSGTSLESNPNIQSFSSARKAADNTTLTTLGWYAVANWLGWVFISSSSTNNTSPLCGSSNGTIVASTGFSGSLCAVGSTVITWSGTGGTTTASTLSWTCKDASNNTGSCSATYNRFSSLGATCDVYDILIGSLTGSYQVWGGCNVGASNTTDWNTTSTIRTQSRDGYTFQFSRDDPFAAYGVVATWTTRSTIATNIFTTALTTIPITTFIINTTYPYDWRQTRLSTVTNTGANIWPTIICPTGYHIPMQLEFRFAYDNWFTNLNYGSVNNLPTALRMPLAGGRYDGAATLQYQGVNGFYWSSSPYADYSYRLDFTTSTLNTLATCYRSCALPVRCIKN